MRVALKGDVFRAVWVDVFRALEKKIKIRNFQSRKQHFLVGKVATLGDQTQHRRVGIKTLKFMWLGICAVTTYCYPTYETQRYNISALKTEGFSSFLCA